jgi:hypothetical protein
VIHQLNTDIPEIKVKRQGFFRNIIHDLMQVKEDQHHNSGGSNHMPDTVKVDFIGISDKVKQCSQSGDNGNKFFPTITKQGEKIKTKT